MRIGKKLQWRGPRRLPEGIRGRLYLLIVLTLLPMLLLLGWIYIDGYQARRAEAIWAEQEVAQGIANTFAAKLTGIHSQSLAVGDAILTFSPLTIAKVRRILTYNANQYQTMRSMSWVSPQGIVLVSSEPAAVGCNLADYPYFRQLSTGTEWSLSTLHPRATNESSFTFFVATAIRDEKGLRGVVVAAIEPANLDEVIFRHSPTSGFFTLFDRQGTLVYRSGTPHYSWDERVSWTKRDPLLSEVLKKGRPFAGEVTLAIPGRWIAARVPVGNTGWVAGSARPARAVLAPLLQRLIQDLALSATIALGALLLAWHLARTIARPILLLQRDARELAAGRRISRIEDSGASREVRQLRATLAEMADRLLDRAVALRASEEKFRAIFEQAAVGIGLVRFSDARWIDVNDAFCRLLGYAKEKMLSTPWPQITCPEDVEADLEPQKMAAGELDSYWIEKRFIHKDGHPVWTRLTLSLVRDADGRPDYEIAIIEDISERKRAEEDLCRLNVELEQRIQERTAALTAANQELEAFTYTVSHDLRAPLRHITSFVELLNNRCGEDLDEKGKRYVEIIGEAGRRMVALIDGLLTFSRLGRAPLVKRTVSLKKLVGEVRKELACEAEGRKIEWRMADLPQVQADPVLLKTVMTNLLANALKYTRHRTPARITVGSREEEGEIVCFVRDNGAGFDMRFADKLFGVFQRLHSEEQFEGSGIGLAGVRRIIQRHGGQTWAEGEVDKGATFYFTLPREGKGS